MSEESTPQADKNAPSGAFSLPTDQVSSTAVSSVEVSAVADVSCGVDLPEQEMLKASSAVVVNMGIPSAYDGVCQND